MASDATYDKVQMASFMKSIFGKYGETLYTKDLLEEVLDAVEREQTFTQFFVRLMNGLFQDEGCCSSIQLLNHCGNLKRIILFN